MILVSNMILQMNEFSMILFSDKQNLRDKKKENVFSKAVITSKWNRVKKVFSGKPESLIMKTETQSATAEQLVKANRLVLRSDLQIIKNTVH